MLVWIRIPLKPELMYTIFKNSVHPAKKTLHFTVRKINLLMLFNDITPIYSENHKKFVYTK